MIFNTIITKIREVINKMFNKSTIEKAANIDIAMPAEFATYIQRWDNISKNKSPWVDNKTVFGMGTGSAIASEFARLVTIEFKSEISNNDFLNEEYQVVIDSIRNYTEFAAAKGGLVFKPFVANNHIEVALIQADAFYPTVFNNRGEITGAIFVETNTKGDTTYTRIEYHNLDKNNYTITNTAFKKKNLNQIYSSSTDNTLGDQVQLAEVEEWANLEPITTIGNIDKPLFAYFKMPLANMIDSSSPLGVSVFAKVADDNGLLQQVDEQYSKILWEYKSKETAIDVSMDMLKVIKGQNGEIVDWGLAKGNERLYRALNIDTTADKTSGYNVFSPDIRDTSLFNGLNELLRQVEFQVGLAYGTLSKEAETAKTATEIKTSKQRSYQTVKDIQKSLKNSLETLGYAMSVLGILYKLPVKPINVEKDMSYDFDDSIVVDKDSELLSMQGDVASGLIRGELYVAKKYGVSESEALKMMPNMDTLITNNPLDSNIDQTTGLPIDNSQSGNIIDDAEEVANKQLNGAQTQSLVAILAQYAAKQLTLGQAINVIAVAIGISKEDAKKIINGTD